MRLAPLVVTGLFATCLGAAAPALAQSADDAFYSAAYDACVAALKPQVKASGAAPVTFAPAEKVTGKFDDEFSISFSFGSITGADFTGAHPITMVDKPVGSCWGVPGERTFTRIILNGAPLNSAPVTF
jgi:hypothetical protein